MEGRIVVEVDADRLAAYIDEVYADQPAEPRQSPREFLQERLQSVADDELPVALWGWASHVGMTARAEVPDA